MNHISAGKMPCHLFGWYLLEGVFGLLCTVGDWADNANVLLTISNYRAFV